MSNRFRLRNMKVTRVDLVDRGANADSHILLAKALHTKDKKPNPFAKDPEDDGKDKKDPDAKKKPNFGRGKDPVDKDKTDAPKSDSKSDPKGGGDAPPIKIKGEVANRIRQFLAEQANADEDPDNPDGEDTPSVDKSPPGDKSASAPDGKPAGDKPKTDFQPSPVNPREKGSRIGEDGTGSRIIRLDPAMFEVVSATGNMMEWAINPEELPDGVEEAMMTMVQSGETVMFQWMIDPLAGPPIEGSAKTAAEAFVSMRGALTNQAAVDPMDPLGGLSGEVPLPGQPGQPGQPPQSGQVQAGQTQPGQPPQAKPDEEPAFPEKKKPVQQALKKRRERIRHAFHGAMADKDKADKDKKKKKSSHKDSSHMSKTWTDSSGNTGYIITTGNTGNFTTNGKTTDQRVTSALDIITKGLVETDVLAETATGDDIRDILPDNLLAKLHNELSA